jgi:LEA14-like dessication related protein
MRSLMAGLHRALALGAVLVALGGCALLDDYIPPEVSLSDLTFEEGSLFEQRVNLVLRVRNPNDFALPLDGYRFDLALNGLPFARGFGNDSVTVPRFGEELIRAKATVSTLDVLRQMIGLAEAKDFAYDLKGTAFVRGVLRREAPFQQTGSLNLGGLMGQGAEGRVTRPR